MFDLFTYAAAAPLSAEDERHTIRAAQAGDTEAYERLLAAYGPVIRKAVGRAKLLDPQDAQATALLAFHEVLTSHDTDNDNYVTGSMAARLAPALWKALSAAIGEEVSPLTVPTRSFERYYGIMQAAAGDPAEGYRLAPKYSMAPETFADIHAAVSTSSLGEYGDDDSIGAVPLQLTYEPYAEVEDRILVDAAFAAMNDEESRICELSYGFTEYEPVADGEIAHRMGLSRPTVQRKRSKALGKAREALGVTHVEAGK